MGIKKRLINLLARSLESRKDFGVSEITPADCDPEDNGRETINLKRKAKHKHDWGSGREC